MARRVGLGISFVPLIYAEASSVHKTTVIHYSRTYNRAFADQIQARLPRELRNMIYEWL
jgi:hypothetical protein